MSVANANNDIKNISIIDKKHNNNRNNSKIVIWNKDYKIDVVVLIRKKKLHEWNWL